MTSRSTLRQAARHGGFTLLELIVVIVITGIIAGMIAIFVTRPVTAYFDTARRAELTENADTASRRIARDLRTALPRDAYICTDVGWNKNGLTQQYPVYEPGTIFTPGGFATMGFGAPAALGADLAVPVGHRGIFDGHAPLLGLRLDFGMLLRLRNRESGSCQ